MQQLKKSACGLLEGQFVNTRVLLGLFMRNRLRVCLRLLGILMQARAGDIFSTFKVCKFVVKCFSSVIQEDRMKLVEQTLRAHFEFTETSSRRNSPARARLIFFRGGEETVEFAGELFRVRRLRRQHNTCLASDWAQKIFFCPITDKRSNKSWNWFFQSSIPGVLSPRS